MTEKELSSNTFRVEGDKKSSAAILRALREAEDYFRDWNDLCDVIDDMYSKRQSKYGAIYYDDDELDLFWSSTEVLKPAIYARPPKPVVTTKFKDRDVIKDKAAELLERVSTTALESSGIDEILKEIRDDLIFYNRGVLWLTYESGKDGQHVCFEHLDRYDFRHDPARRWCDVGWVARRAWMTRKELVDRFGEIGHEIKLAKYYGDKAKDEDCTLKGAVWEVWHRADNRVYWVAEDVEEILDEGEPHLKLRGFFPCPRPAYGTKERRSLVPVPDWTRYKAHFSKINELTARIYLLLDRVRMVGLIPAGGTISDAITAALNNRDDEFLIQVPAAPGDIAGSVVWMPLNDLATTIQGLIQARSQLIEDYYQLSGISDIMRGASDPNETLGAQQIKTQYGSVRVREKIEEIQRVVADAIAIAAEIIAENFTEKSLLEMSQMKISTAAEIEKQIKGIEKAAEQELKALGNEMQKGVANIPPEEAQAQLQQAQQQILQKYAPMLQQVNSEVPIDEIMTLLRDDKARSFAFEVASDSTIMTDEMQEKASRNEFMKTLVESSTALMGLAQLNKEGAELAGGLLNFVLGPYRAGRELDSLINNFIESAGQFVNTGQDGQEEQRALIEAQHKLAEAEMAKAQAQTQKVQADAIAKQAELEGRMREQQAKYQVEVGRLELQLSKQQQEYEAKIAEIEAKTNLMQAQTAEILSRIGLNVRKQNLEEYQAAKADEQRNIDNALRASAQSMNGAINGQ